MRIVLSLVASVSLLGVMPAAASAQITDLQRESLRGLREVRIVVEPPNESARACGVSLDGLELSVVPPIVDADIAIEEAVPALLYVNVHVLPTCVAYVLVSAQTSAPVFLPYSRANATVFATVDLWRAGYLMDGDAADLGNRVNLKVHEFATEFAALVKLAN